MKFTSLDFETANHSHASICAAGIAVFEDGTLKESRHWLIRPDFTTCHGLTWFDVQSAPEFPAIAPDLLRMLTASDFIVAHNAQFDLRKLHTTLAHFGFPCPPLNCRCTLKLARRVWPNLPSHSLDALAAHIHHEFRHHNAQSDAETAGRVLLALIMHADALLAEHPAKSDGTSRVLFRAPIIEGAGIPHELRTRQ